MKDLWKRIKEHYGINNVSWKYNTSDYSTRRITIHDTIADLSDEGHSLKIIGSGQPAIDFQSHTDLLNYLIDKDIGPQINLMSNFSERKVDAKGLALTREVMDTIAYQNDTFEQMSTDTLNMFTANFNSH